MEAWAIVSINDHISVVDLTDTEIETEEEVKAALELKFQGEVEVMGLDDVWNAEDREVFWAHQQDVIEL